MFYNTGDKEYIREKHDSVSLGNVDEIVSALKENERRCESIQDTLILCINILHSAFHFWTYLLACFFS